MAEHDPRRSRDEANARRQLWAQLTPDTNRTSSVPEHAADQLEQAGDEEKGARETSETMARETHPEPPTRILRRAVSGGAEASPPQAYSVGFLRPTPKTEVGVGQPNRYQCRCGSGYRWLGEFQRHVTLCPKAALGKDPNGSDESGGAK